MSSLADLFARDPLKLTKEDRSQIIAHFRANRQSFMTGLKEPKVKAAPKAKEPKAPKVPKDKITGLSLADLFVPKSDD